MEFQQQMSLFQFRLTDPGGRDKTPAPFVRTRVCVCERETLLTALIQAWHFSGF